MPAQGQQG